MGEKGKGGDKERGLERRGKKKERHRQGRGERRERKREQKLPHQERGKQREGRLEEAGYPLPKTEKEGQEEGKSCLLKGQCTQLTDHTSRSYRGCSLKHEKVCLSDISL